mgnify:CR=1 FL=1
MTVLDTLTDLLGTAHVLTGDACAAYTTDWTGEYVATPLAVVRPASTEDVSKIVKACSEHQVPIAIPLFLGARG